MIIIIAITLFLALLYLIYPLWLDWILAVEPISNSESKPINDVSIIYLSYNGSPYLLAKINFLLRELSAFEKFELIIIDDYSTDGSIDFLKKIKTLPHVNVLFNNKHQGIPFSMNSGVSSAKYNYIVFCDQRQELSDGILHRIIRPLESEDVGAVSCCISAMDKERKCSFFRKHENFLKLKESMTGNLMGVYGPLYAIKKECYYPIPPDIILDDLYLSLNILKSKQIRLAEHCEVVDDNFELLYDYDRTKRYLMGLLQILKYHSLINKLNLKQRTMLAWHKYLRLIIPLFIISSFAALGILSFRNNVCLILFCMLTVLLLTSVLPTVCKLQTIIKHFLKISIFYTVAFADIILHQLFFNGSELIKLKSSANQAPL